MQHEVQHAIQRMEGFARGGNTESVRKRIQEVIDGEQDASDYAKEKLQGWASMKMAADRLDDLYGSYIDSNDGWLKGKAVDAYWDAMHELDNNPDSRLANEYPAGTAEEIAESGYHVEDAKKELRRLAQEAYDSIPKGNMDAMELVRKLSEALKDSDLELYRRLSGEVEARNVQKRMGMTPEERRASLAGETEDVAREDQIFLYGPDGVDAMSREKNVDGSLEDVNERFNEQIGSFTQEDADKTIFDLGRPSGKLLAGGVEDKPIRLYGSKVVKKMKKHGFTIDELRDLPKAVADPIAVFANKEREGNRSVLTELSTANGNFLVTIDLGKGTDADFDIVSSVFGKHGYGVATWINKGYMKYVDKGKALNYLHLSAPIAEASENPELLSAANVVRNFENPKLSGENVAGDEGMLFRDGDRKRLRDGAVITFRRKPTATYNAVKRWLTDNGIEYSDHKARTGSMYMSFVADDVDYNIRNSDHTVPEYGVGSEYGRGEHISHSGDRVSSVDIDLCNSELRAAGVRRLVSEVSGLNKEDAAVRTAMLRDRAVPRDVEDRYPVLCWMLGVGNDEEKRLRTGYAAYVKGVRDGLLSKVYPFTAGNGIVIEQDGTMSHPTWQTIWKTERKRAEHELFEAREKAEEEAARRVMSFDEWARAQGGIVSVPRAGDVGMKFRLLGDDDPKARELEALPEGELVPVYRNVQVFGDDTLGSPMAFTDAETGERRTLEGGKWNYSNPPQVKLTEEQQRKLDELNENGYLMVDGKKTTELPVNDGLKFVKPKTKPAQLQYFLKKNPEDKGLWAAYDPYDHAIETPLNTQFGEAYKRPNLVVVRSLIPKSEIDEPFHADYALLPTGAHQWNNGRTLYLSRWSKIDKVLSREEEAKLIDEYWKKHPGKREALKTHRDYNRFVPEVRKELEKMGYRFEHDGKVLTPEESLALDRQREADVIPGREGHLPYITGKDIERINAKMAGKWVGEPKEAMENEMAARVEDLSKKLGTPVRIIRTDEEVSALPTPRQRRQKGSFNSLTGEVTIVVPNNANLADIENTFIHEVVGHDGLRVLFPEEEKLNNALDELYRVSNDSIKHTIDRMAQKMYESEVDRLREKKRKEHEAKGEDANASYYADMAEAHAEANKKREQFKRDATEEYGADLAGRIGDSGFEKMSAGELTFWGKLKAMLQKALQKLLAGLKIPGKKAWGDKEWAFVLHEAYKRKKNGGRPTVFDAADTEVMKRKTGFDEATDREADGRMSDNERFNNELTRYQNGDMDKNEMLHLGKPQGVMRQFLPDLPIIMRQRVIKKGSEKKHEVDVSAIMNMPQHLSSPIFVFQRSEDTIGVLTDMKDRNGKNVCVAIELKRQIQKGNEYLEVNDVRSFHGREFKNIVEPIVKNKTLKWVDKEKGLAYLSSASQPVQQEIDKQVLNDATKVVENFENSKVSDGNVAGDEDVMFRDGDAVDYEKAQARARYEERVSRGMYQVQEAMQDSMLGLKEAMDAVLRAEGHGDVHIEDVAGYENAYLGENRLSSVNQAECDAFERTLFKPLLDKVAALAKTADGRAELTDYMMAKHGLERNEVMARRAAAKKAKGEVAKVIKKLERIVNGRTAGMAAKGKAAKKIGEMRALVDGIKNGLPQSEAQAWYDARRKAIDTRHANGHYTAEQYKSAVNKLGILYNNGLAGWYERGFRNRDYAGLTALTMTDNVADAEQEARRMVADYEGSHDRWDVMDLWDRVNDVTGATLGKTYESGLISKATYDDIRGMYKWYVPLRGFDEKTSDEAYGYLNSGRSAFNSPIKTAKGRKSKADDPLANMESMAESAIMQGNRNVLVKQKFLNFALNHPSDLVSVGDVWLRYDDMADEWWPVNTGDVAGTERLEETDSPAEVERKMAGFNAAMEQLAAQEPDRYVRQRERPDVPYRVVGSENLHEHQVVAKRGGKDYLLTINGNPRAAQALNGRTNPDAKADNWALTALDVVGDVNRTLSMVYTTLQPDFVASNFLRDTVYANSMVWVKESPEYAARYNANYVKTKRVMSLLGKLRKGTLDMNDETERLFKQFMENGGETGYMRMADIDVHKKEVQAFIDKVNAKIPAKEVREYMATWLGEVGRGIEMRARFAAYLTSREMGRSTDRSVWDAKEISVNFNKKGAGDRFLKAEGQTAAGKWAAGISGAGRALYLFWNAAIQGTFGNFGKAAVRHPRKMAALVGANFMLGLLVTALASSGGDDDDDSYYDLPEHVRRQNFIVKGPGRTWIKVPLPQEYRAVYGLGELAGCTLFNHERLDAGKMAAQVTQVLPVDAMEGTSGLWPSSIKPAVDVAHNESWYGSPIWKDTEWNKHMPQWTKAYKNANPDLVNLAAVLNDVSGGSKYRKGAVDLNPAAVEYLLKQYTGGYFTVANQIRNLASVANGDKEFDWKYVPLVNRVLMTGGDERNAQHGLNEKFFQYMDRYDAKQSEISAIKNDGELTLRKKAELISEVASDEDFKVLRKAAREYSHLAEALKRCRANGLTDKVKELEKRQKDLKQRVVKEMEARER